MNEQAASIRLEKVSKRFGDVIAVDGITLDVAPGSLLTLLGPSGCGKTTTLRMIAGLERASSGRILIDNEDVTRLPANHRDVTMVFQSYALFPHMNVFDNVSYGLQVAHQAKDVIRRHTLETLELVGLDGLERRPTNALSGGQQQRVALARALVMQPKVLLFDEPLSNLDAKLRKHVREEIHDLQRNLGITSVYVTHDQEEALAISDEIVLINQGRIVQRGTPHQLYTRPANHFVADFIGSASFLPGTFNGSRLRIGDYSFPYRQEAPSGEVAVMVRPEAVVLAEQGKGLETTVKSTAYLGAITDYVFASPVGDIMASIPGEGLSPLHRGDTAFLAFKTAGVYLLPAVGDTQALLTEEVT